MPESQLIQLSIAGLVAAQESGELTATAIVTDRLEALSAQVTTVNAVIEWDPADALAQAADIDARRRSGEPLGPLAGVPITIKDSFDVAGLLGSIGTASTVHRSADDAPAVARWRAAGAIIIGKTNIPAYLAASDSANALYGRTLNPWNAAHTAGGSSGGSAAAVAAGLSWGDLGSDLSGSIRVPSAWCGVYGHRPTSGVVSKRGHLPWPIAGLIDPTASAAGPIARSADDLSILVATVAGIDGPEARIWRLTLPEPRTTGLRGLRVGVWREESSAPVDAETAIAMDEFVAALRDAGCVVTEIRDSVLATREAEDLFARLIAHEIDYGADLEAGLLDESTDHLAGASAARIWADWDAQRRLRARWELVFDSVDVVIAPAAPTAAPTVDLITTPDATVDLGNGPEPFDRLVGRWSCMANLAMGPSTVIPIALGSVGGLPIGIQAIGRFGDDLTTLAFARAVSNAGLVPKLRPPA